MPIVIHMSIDIRQFLLIQSASAHSAGPCLLICRFVGMWVCLFGGLRRIKAWRRDRRDIAISIVIQSIRTHTIVTGVTQCLRGGGLLRKGYESRMSASNFG